MRDLRLRFSGALLVAIVAAACAPAPSPNTSSASASPAAASSTPSSAASLVPSPTNSLAPSLGPSTAPALVEDTGLLDGVPTSATLADRLPLAIMIGDNVQARPQAGFNAASIVYQAPADGGEDRYMLVFQEGDAKLVGPVRSGRPYFVRWAAEFRAAFGHYGGDAKTLQQVIPSMDGTLIFDVDALRNGGAAFHRVGTRSAPDNGYTSTAAFRAQALKLRAPATMVAGLPTWTFTDDRPPAERPASGSISIPYGRGVVGYTYDRTANDYLRSVAGKPQIDAGDGQRVIARNVIVLFMALSYDPQSEPGHRRPVLAQIGSGTALVFRDGAVIKATWRKDDVGGLTRLFDANGLQVALVRGRVFIQVVPTGTKVSSSFH
jgi:Protein of unknown function (DUF3048) N-terminal domain/Protein of unknown function (DUF3048) C-terminal domain